MLKLGDLILDRWGKNVGNYCHQFQQATGPYEQQNGSLMLNLLVFQGWFDLSMTSKTVQNQSTKIYPPLQIIHTPVWVDMSDESLQSRFVLENLISKKGFINH